MTRLQGQGRVPDMLELNANILKTFTDRGSVTMNHRPPIGNGIWKIIWSHDSKSRWRPSGGLCHVLFLVSFCNWFEMVVKVSELAVELYDVLAVRLI